MACKKCPDGFDRAIDLVEQGARPEAVVEALLQTDQPKTEQDFFQSDEKTRNFIQGAGLPREGFFRACVDKFGDEDFIEDGVEEFCGKLKAAAVRLGLAEEN